VQVGAVVRSTYADKKIGYRYCVVEPTNRHGSQRIFVTHLRVVEIHRGLLEAAGPCREPTRRRCVAGLADSPDRVHLHGTTDQPLGNGEDL